MVRVQRHRGPDDAGVYLDASGLAGLGHNRLSIIDLSNSGHQPMQSAYGGYWIVFNGEIYNYRELRAELSDYPFSSATDTEVILAAYCRWGEACLERFQGMFAFLIWDERKRSLFAARDRFGVKPLYYQAGSTLRIASEIKALHAGGIPAEPDERTWATYLTHGRYDCSDKTFWKNIVALPPGHVLRWAEGRTEIAVWYDLSERVGPEVDRPRVEKAKQDYRDLLIESVQLRFRSDVPVGINLSGGLDSSLLLGAVQNVQGVESDVRAYTFVTGDPNYDELPWVSQMLARTRHRSVVCSLSANQVPELAQSVQEFQDEPFGGLPTLAYARLFETAQADGTLVLLDGQGMDEQWAGYDYYSREPKPNTVHLVQGSQESPVRPACLDPEFRALAEPAAFPRPFPDHLRNLLYRDIRYTKIPRALRFNDRVSMRSSVELREPFLDHRLVEYAMRLPAEYKIVNDTRKWLLRQIASDMLPENLAEAPKRPLQTPQREWLRGHLRSWAQERTEEALERFGGWWLNRAAVRACWERYCAGESDNSFYVWQWISLGMMAARMTSETVQHV